MVSGVAVFLESLAKVGFWLLNYGGSAKGLMVGGVLLESNSLSAVALVNKGRSLRGNDHGGLSRVIFSRLERDWEVIVSHVFRESNRAADCLAGLGMGLDVDWT